MNSSKNFHRWIALLAIVLVTIFTVSACTKDKNQDELRTFSSLETEFEYPGKGVDRLVVAKQWASKATTPSEWFEILTKSVEKNLPSSFLDDVALKFRLCVQERFSEWNFSKLVEFYVLYPTSHNDPATRRLLGNYKEEYCSLLMSNARSWHDSYAILQAVPDGALRDCQAQDALRQWNRMPVLINRLLESIPDTNVVWKACVDSLLAAAPCDPCVIDLYNDHPSLRSRIAKDFRQAAKPKNWETAATTLLEDTPLQREAWTRIESRILSMGFPDLVQWYQKSWESNEMGLKFLLFQQIVFLAGGDPERWFTLLQTGNADLHDVAADWKGWQVVAGNPHYQDVPTRH
jgi:hypothetical protein